MKKLITALVLLVSGLACAQPPGGFGGFQIQSSLGTSQEWKDVNYVGDDKAYHTCDIYLPEQEKKSYPVVIHIYGSAWFNNNGKGAADLGTIVKALLNAGYAVVCPNHRASGDAQWPAQLHDIKAVVRFIRGEAQRYKFDPSFIATSGFSSGGHLASTTAMTSGTKRARVGSVDIDLEGSLGKYTKKSSVVNAACDWSGPIDLTAMDCGEHMTMGDRSPEDILLNAKLSEEPDKYRSLSATTYIDAKDPPVIVFHGEKDNVVPCCQGKAFYEALKAAGVPTEASFVPNGGHGIGMYSEENLQKMVRFLDAVRNKTLAKSVNLTKTTIVYQESDAPLVKQMAQVLADDIERVSGIKPAMSTRPVKGPSITLSTVQQSGRHRELRGEWERFAIDTKDGNICITGSDARGLAYGVLHVSEAIGVSPWYWFADVPVNKANGRVYAYAENFVSASPSVKYRGFFINDEDWGLKTWAAKNYEQELNDIGPKTYDRVCELILRLKGNMLAPAMHSCTGAFYSHPESQKMADKWGIMITTSHCEPLLFNNAARSEWDKERDGEWNYETNSATILKKLDDRIRETAQYDNIYTMGLRGLHDEAMKGSKDPKDRARTLEKVFENQRAILEKYKGKKAERLPQIFVPYKETLDIYDAGLRVPEDITLVWPDDNYGYMKRVSNAKEQQRSGRSGVYYHISYLGTPHDNLWIATTAPMLMYEELFKAYTAGADRYWLLNVGDIKPMEIETQMFMDMAYDLKSFSYENVNNYQATLLARLFDPNAERPALKGQLQFILDNYYRLAWDRKPEFMGYEMEWDSQENSRLHDTDFSFQTGSAQKRLTDYQDICFAYDAIERQLTAEQRPAFFEMLGYAVHSAYQMNRKFLYAQANHETGNASYAEQSKDACQEIERLLERYNTQLGGKWNQMISQVPPGFTAKYHQKPEYSYTPTNAYRLPEEQRHPEFDKKIDLASLAVSEPFRLLDGIGTDWKALQMGQPLDASQSKASIDIAIPANTLPKNADSVSLCISVVPFWPVATDCSNRFAVSVDHGKAEICENLFQEWSQEWKLQVLENRKEFVLTLPLDTKRADHVITLSMVDPGQIIQKITYQ